MCLPWLGAHRPACCHGWPVWLQNDSNKHLGGHEAVEHLLQNSRNRNTPPCWFVLLAPWSHFRVILHLEQNFALRRRRENHLTPPLSITRRARTADCPFPSRPYCAHTSRSCGPTCVFRPWQKFSLMYLCTASLHSNPSSRGCQMNPTSFGLATPQVHARGWSGTSWRIKCQAWQRHSEPTLTAAQDRHSH